MQIQNQAQLALLWHIKKKAKNIFEKFLWWTMYIKFDGFITLNRGVPNIVGAWNLKDAISENSKNKIIKKQLIADYIKKWYTMDDAEKEANKIISTKVKQQLISIWHTILITECTQIDPNTNQIVWIYNKEFYDLLLWVKRDNKLLEIITWTLAQFSIMTNNVLANENQSLSTWISWWVNYNISTVTRKLTNHARTQFDRQLKDRYISEKNRLSPKNMKYNWVNY